MVMNASNSLVLFMFSQTMSCGPGGRATYEPHKPITVICGGSNGYNYCSQYGFDNEKPVFDADSLRLVAHDCEQEML